MDERTKSKTTAASAINSDDSNYIVLMTAICTAIISIMLLMPLSAPTAASSNLPLSRDIFTLYDTYNMTVVVTFDKEPPTIQFVAPNGSNVDMDNIRYRSGSNFIQYFLPNAMPGLWRMAYDPLINTVITTPYSVYMNHIFIRNFSADISRATDELLQVIFEVSSDGADYFSYELHAVLTTPDNSISDDVLLAIGYGMLNDKIALSVDIEELQDMGGFMLRLTAYVKHGQAAIRDSAWLDLRL